MSICFRCGVSEDRAKLLDVISNKGIIKACENCISLEHLPVIKKVSEDRFNESPKQRSIHERLAQMGKPRGPVREISLRELIDKNLKEKKLQNPSDLIDNFHWTIQRIRRIRKITREEFARGISEPESVVRMIEQGFFPENNYKIINKVESFLKVSLRKPGSSGFPDTGRVNPSQAIPEKNYSLDNSMISESDLSFDKETTKRLRIRDLLGLKKKQGEKKEEAIKKEDDTTWEEEYSQDDERFLDPKEDIDDFDDEER